MAVSATESLDQRLEAYLASDPAAIRDPFPMWSELRESAAVYEHGPSMFVTTHAACKAVVRNDGVFSSASGRKGTRAEAIRAGLTPEQRAKFDELGDLKGKFVVAVDRPEHDRLRAILHRAFTPRKIRELEGVTQAWVDELLAPMAEEGRGDLKTFAYRLPLMIVCDLLGAPTEDREQIHDWSLIVGRNRSGTDPDPRYMLEAYDAWGEFRTYVAELIDAHRRSSRPSELVEALMEAEGDKMTVDELTVAFVVMLFAGHETTTNLIGNGLFTLFSNRDQWEALAADPGLAPQATEELLRFVTPVQWINRVALEDTELEGVSIPEGQTVLPALAAANRDPAVFTDPDRFDIQRSDARNHLALGFGIHHCLGASLARLEGTIALGTLARRFPRLELEVAPAELTWRGHAKLRGVSTLPATLGPERAM